MQFHVPSDQALRSPDWTAAVHVSRPERVSAYQCDAGGAVTVDRDAWPPRYCPVRPGLDLGDGLGSYEPGGGLLERSERLLGAAGGDEAAVAMRVGVVTYRNNLNKVLGTPFSRDGWSCGAWVDASGRLRLEMEEYAGRPVPGNRPLPEREARKFDYWGRHYEARATGAARVCAAEQTVLCLRARIGAHVVLLGAEVDAWEEDGRGGRRLVEIKTTRLPASERTRATLQRKMCKWWVQSFLGGVPVVRVGLRDDKGRVVGDAHVATREIPRMLRDGRTPCDGERQALPPSMRPRWDANVCLNFGERLLAWARREIGRAAPGARHRLVFEPPFRAVRLERAQ